MSPSEMQARIEMQDRIAALEAQNKAMRERVEELESMLKASMRAMRSMSEKVEGGAP